MMHPQPTDNAFNVAMGIGVGIFILIFCIFFAALMGSTAGEIAGATGAVLGGAIGAMGAALAVYLTLSGQKNEEREKIGGIVVREVTDFSRLIMGQLENCELVANETVKIPTKALPDAMQMPEPIVYRAVADRLALVRSPQQVVSFYTRISEIKTMLAVMAGHPDSDKPVTKEQINPVAQGWIDLLQIAVGIVGDKKPVAGFDDIVRGHMQKQIIDALARGRSVFPEPKA